jgi:hypothetical protein
VLWWNEYVDLCVRAADSETALDCLDRSPHYREYRGVVTDPVLARLRGNARFARVLDERRRKWEDNLARYASYLPVLPPKL